MESTFSVLSGGDENQILRLRNGLTSTGFVRSYTFDGGRQDETGVITFFEIKAHQAYFEEPETYDRLQEAEQEWARHGIKLERIVGDRFEGVKIGSASCRERVVQ